MITLCGCQSYRKLSFRENNIVVCCRAKYHFESPQNFKEVALHGVSLEDTFPNIQNQINFDLPTTNDVRNEQSNRVDPHLGDGSDASNSNVSYHKHKYEQTNSRKKKFRKKPYRKKFYKKAK